MARVLRLAVSLVLLSALGFGLVGLLPGDPVTEALQRNPHMKAQDVERLRAYYGLDQPLPVRYAKWVGRFAQGDWGRSRTYHLSATKLLGQRLGNTVVLFAATLCLAAVLFAAGYALQGLRPDGFAERASQAASTFFLCIPPFWLGLMMIFLFAVTLGWLPLGGTGTLEGASGLGRWRWLLLPSLVLALEHVGQWLRLERPYSLSMQEQLWHKAGRAKGMPPVWLFFRRQGKMTLGRLSTVWALDLPVLLGRALITETVFNWPGVARLLYESVLHNDSDLAMACLLFLGLLTLVANQLADVAVAWFDPRARKGA